MAERRVVVPYGMLKAAVDAAVKFSGANTIQASPRVKSEIEGSFQAAVEAAVLWLTENPRVPTREQVVKLSGFDKHEDDCKIQQFMIVARAWIETMFLAPEPEVPEEIKDLLSNPEQFDPHPFFGGKIGLHEVVEAIAVEAFRRGKASR